jgi:hypothetical protein
LASEALGANARLGSLAAKFTEFGIGSAETLGMLAGVAAIALAWEKLNESTRKANEETQKAIGLLREVRLKKLLGPGGETGDAVEKAKGQLPLEIQKQDQLTAGLASFGKDQLSIRALQIRQELADQRSKISEMKALISDGEEEVVRLKKEAARQSATGPRQTASIRNTLRGRRRSTASLNSRRTPATHWRSCWPTQKGRSSAAKNSTRSVRGSLAPA